MLVVIRGAGDIATGIAARLHAAGCEVVMCDIERPTTVRRTVAFSEAIRLGACEVEGVRAYEFARAGEEVELRKNLINIYDLQLERCELPSIGIRVRCSKGTYIRSLAAEIGEALESGAYLTSLRRVRSGGFTAEGAMSVTDFLEMLEKIEDK